MLVNLEGLKKPEEQRAELKKSIYRAKGQIEKQTENLKELFGLIKKRPDLPIVAMVDSEIVADDGCCYWMGSWGSCLIDKYIVHEDYGVIFYEEGKPDTVDIFVWSVDLLSWLTQAICLHFAGIVVVTEIAAGIFLRAWHIRDLASFLC